MCAITLDGKIAKNSGEFINWTGSEDKKIFARETKKSGVVIMGNNTYKTIGRPLKDRLNVVLTSNTVNKTSQKGVLEFTSHSPSEIQHDLVTRGFKKVFVIGGGEVNALFMKIGLIDEVWLTVVPKVFGKGISLFGDFDGDVALEFISCERLANGLIFVKYRILR